MLRKPEIRFLALAWTIGIMATLIYLVGVDHGKNFC